MAPGATAEGSSERTAVPSCSRWGDTPGTGSPGRAVCNQGWDLSREPCPLGRWDQRRKRGSCERLSEEQGTLHGAHGKETLQASGAQAAGILLPFRLSTSRHSGVPLLHGTSPGIKKGMNLKTKSEMLFPGREKSGLVTPNSTDCAIPKGLGGA